MRAKLPVLITLIAILGLAACGQKKAETPPAISAHFHALVDSLPVEPSGASVEQLQAFMREHEQYQIADTAAAELERMRAAVAGRYHDARELARQGEFDRAESLLEELATHFSDTPDGKSPQQFLEFEYHLGKAQWLTLNQRFDEAESVARDLLDRDLNGFQANQVETILDNLGYVGTAMSMSERANAQSACRQVAIMLATMYVEEGQYPRRLALEDLERWGGSSTIRGLSAIEDYTATRDGFSFVGVSKSGQHRIVVADGEIQE